MLGHTSVCATIVFNRGRRRVAERRAGSGGQEAKRTEKRGREWREGKVGGFGKEKHSKFTRERHCVRIGLPLY